MLWNTLIDPPTLKLRRAGNPKVRSTGRAHSVYAASSPWAQTDWSDTTDFELLKYESASKTNKVRYSH